MHGFPKGEEWYPFNEKLRAKSVSIEDIVTSYEKSGGESIDALFICNSKPAEVVKIVPFAGYYDTPRIYMKEGNAHGGCNT